MNTKHTRHETFRITQEITKTETWVKTHKLETDKRNKRKGTEWKYKRKRQI